MSPRLTSLCLLILPIAISSACVVIEGNDPDRPAQTTSTPEWCEGVSCEEGPTGEDTTPVTEDGKAPADTTEPDPNHDQEAPEAPETQPEDMEDPPDTPTHPEDRPTTIAMPEAFVGEVQQLALHERYGCAIIDWEVTCWGDNTWGQAQPPEDIWGDMLALGPDYACAASGPSGIQCWGDGAWRVQAAIDENTILGRHRIPGLSAASTGVLCYQTGYGGSVGQLGCGDDNEHWQIGEDNTFGVSVTYEHQTRRRPFICWIQDDGDWGEDSAFSYWCSIDGQATRLPDPPEAQTPLDIPQIAHDGVDTVTVVDAEGIPHWYKLDFTEPCRGADPFPYFQRLDVDTSNHFFPERPGGTTLLTPNCVQKQTQIICRDNEDNLEVMRPTIAKQSAGYENSLEFQLCLVDVVRETRQGDWKEIQCETFARD